MVALATIAILVLVSFVVLTSNPRVLNQDLLNQCNTQWPLESPGPNITQREEFSVLLASPGTSPRFCVGYSSLIDNEVSIQLYGLVVPLGSSGGTISVLADPPTLTVPNDNNGQSPVGIAYAVFTLQISNSSHGFYVMDMPGDCPRLLAVGYSAAQVNESDFGTWVQRSLSSAGNPQIAPDFDFEIEGVWNLNATSLYVS